MISPRRGGNVYSLCTRVEALEEGTTNAQGAGTGDGLGDDDAVLFDGSRVRAIGKLESCLCESRHAGDAGVLLVERCFDNLLLGLLYGGEDKRLALVVTVGTDTCRRKLQQHRSGLVDERTQVDLLGVAVGLESFGDAYTQSMQRKQGVDGTTHQEWPMRKKPG